MPKGLLPEISKLISVHAVKAYEAVEVELHSFLNSA